MQYTELPLLNKMDVRSFNYQKGKKGEKRAVNFLRLRLYEILEVNYTAANGEIDIIAKKGKTIVFVEVKYRLNTNNGYPAEAVNEAKIRKIRTTALCYIGSKNIKDMDFRFDVIEILDKHIEHIKNAF